MSGGIFWRCKCACGNKISVRGVRLRSRKPTTSCGCQRHRIDLTNRRIGLLLVCKRDTVRERREGKGPFWIVRCDCGKKASVWGISLRSSRPTRSCGCLSQSNHKREMEKYVGRRFGSLTVIRVRKGKTQTELVCECDCGKQVATKGSHKLIRGMKTCGCRAGRKVPKIGQKFGRLTVSSRAGTSRWKCRCNCGNYRVFSRSELSHNVSCGCAANEKTFDVFGVQLTIKEIAVVMGVSRGLVQQRLVKTGGIVDARLFTAANKNRGRTHRWDANKATAS